MFDPYRLTTLIRVPGGGFGLHHYRTDDVEDDIMAEGYFTTGQTNLAGEVVFLQGDLIIVHIEVGGGLKFQLLAVYGIADTLISTVRLRLG